MFPEEFWLELARLEWGHYSPHSRPLALGSFTTRLTVMLGKKLPEELVIDGWKKLAAIRFHDQIERVITIMKFARVFKKSPAQLSLFDFDRSRQKRPPLMRTVKTK